MPLEPTVTAVALHDEPAVRKIIEQSYEIANDTTSDPGQWAHVFVKAAELLGQRVPIISQPTTVPVPGGFLGRH